MRDCSWLSGVAPETFAGIEGCVRDCPSRDCCPDPLPHGREAGLLLGMRCRTHVEEAENRRGKEWEDNENRKLGRAQSVPPSRINIQLHSVVTQGMLSTVFRSREGELRHDKILATRRRGGDFVFGVLSVCRRGSTGGRKPSQ